ncbi:MAG: hypothetical protein MI920_09765, partial [Kiloniellales bacterium]|nr:hypothetical protein [Kiloniellales bacterium]
MTNHPYVNTGVGAPPLRAEPHQRTGHSAQAAGHIHGVNATSGGLVRATLGSMAAALAILLLFWLPAEYGFDPTGLGRVMGLTQMGEIKQQLYADAVDEEAVLAAKAAAERVSADPALIARLDALENQLAGIAAALGVAPLQPSAPAAAPVAAPVAAPAAVAPAPEAAAPAAVAPAPAAPAVPAWRDEVSYTLAPTEGIEIKLVMNKGARAEFAWTANGPILNYDTHGDGGGQRITYERGRGVPEQSGDLVAAFDGNHGWFWRNRT